MNWLKERLRAWGLRVVAILAVVGIALGLRVVVIHLLHWLLPAHAAQIALWWIDRTGTGIGGLSLLGLMGTIEGQSGKSVESRELSDRKTTYLMEKRFGRLSARRLIARQKVSLLHDEDVIEGLPGAAAAPEPPAAAPSAPAPKSLPVAVSGTASVAASEFPPDVPSGAAAEAAHVPYPPSPYEDTSEYSSDSEEGDEVSTEVFDSVDDFDSHIGGNIVPHPSAYIVGRKYSAVAIGKLDKAANEQPAKFVNFRVFEMAGKTARELELHEGIYTNTEYKLAVKMGMLPDVRFAGATQETLKRPETASVVLDVVVALADNLEIIGQQWATMDWPVSGESTRWAEFGFKARLQSDKPARLKVLIYYHHDLLFCGDLHLDVLAEGDDWPADRRGIRWFQLPEDKAYGLSIFRSFQDLDDHNSRRLNISVHRDDDSAYDLLFYIKSAAGEPVVYPIRLDVSREELTGFLVRSRAAMRLLVDDGVLSTSNGEKTFSSEAVETLLESMMLLGQDLRNTLFASANGDRLLEKLDSHLQAEAGSVIQIWLDSRSNDFIFPWVWLHTKAVESGRTIRIDFKEFWGYRHVIEQIRHDPKRVRPPSIVLGPPVRLATGIHNFAPASQQKQFFERWVSTRPSNLSYSEIASTSTAWEVSLKNFESNILYLYCHGHTEQSSDPRFAELIRKLKQLEAQSGQKTFNVWEILEQQNIRGESYIQIGNVRLNLTNLGTFRPANDLMPPLIFLNMCESAELYPGLSNNLVDVFLKRGARGVIGTEVPVLATFGDEFSRRFFDLFFTSDQKDLSGQSRSVGLVLLQLRREFLDKGNPLGFAYTYYGDVSTRLDPAVLIGSN